MKTLAGTCDLRFSRMREESGLGLSYIGVGEWGYEKGSTWGEKKKLKSALFCPTAPVPISVVPVPMRVVPVPLSFFFFFFFLFWNSSANIYIYFGTAVLAHNSPNLTCVFMNLKIVLDSLDTSRSPWGPLYFS